MPLSGVWTRVQPRARSPAYIGLRRKLFSLPPRQDQRPRTPQEPRRQPPSSVTSQQHDQRRAPKDNKGHKEVRDNHTGRNAEDGGETLDGEDSWDDENDGDIWDEENDEDTWGDIDEEDMCYISPALWAEILAEDEARRREDDMIDAGYDEDDDMSSGSEV